MIKDIISFITANQKFAIDFQTTPIILRADDYLHSKKINDGSEVQKIHFEGESVEIFDLSQTLNLGISGISNSSRLLVGEIRGKMFGLLVDRVIEIINLNGDSFEFRDIIDANGFIDISGEKLKVIDVNHLLKISRIKLSTDNI